METKTQKIKKLRYLEPKYVSEPNLFIKEIVRDWNINWSVHFGFLFSYSMCPQLDKNRVFEYGFTYIHLAQMIEAAYTILKMMNWQPTAKKKLFRYKHYGELRSFLEKEKMYPQQIICDFFGFMNLRDWYDFLDELLLSSDIKNTCDFEIRPEHLMARELVVLLPDALLKLHEDNTESIIHNT